MNTTLQGYIENLNHPEAAVRLDSLKKLKEAIDRGDMPRPEVGGDVNNHIHTTYSFSPYSPAKALWMAYNAGLITAGIMDHDSISGAREFIEAGKIIGMATTIGAECRVDFSGTPLKGKKINNPDQNSIAYMTLHGVPHTQIDRVREFFAPLLDERNDRNRRMVEKINTLFQPYGITLDFEKEVKPLSMNHDGGSITERHILFALSRKLISVFGKGGSLVEFLKGTLRLNLPVKLEGLLLDTENAFYDYDLLGALKSDLVEHIYIKAATECPDVREVIRLADEIGAIAAYAYLGDVGDSVTGDKKTQKFEDDYLDELFDILKELGFRAVTYMPSRNTMEQLRRVKALCDRHGLFQISGEDINSPRQSFVCMAMRKEEFDNLRESTWALIGHEKAATEDLSKAFFSRATIEKYPDLNIRTQVYKELGKSL